MSAYVHAPRDTTYQAPRYATAGQIEFMERILTRNSFYDGHYDRLWKLLEVHRIDMRTPGDGTRMDSDTAGKTIDWLLRREAEARKAARHLTSVPVETGPDEALAPGEQLELDAPAVKTTPEAVTVGVYKKDGEVYVVKPNRSGTRVYAKKVVESAERVTEAGAHVHFELEYAPGMVYKLAEADRMPLADAKELMIRYGKCIVCGRHLKAAKSVEAGIGPVCARNFA